MLDKPQETALTTIEGKDLAIGIQFSTAYEGSRSLVLTTGVPLDISQEGLEMVIARLSKASESLNDKYRLEALKLELKRWLFDHDNAKQQRANLEVVVANDWSRRDRKGAPKMSAQQDAQARNFDLGIKRCADEVKRVRQEIAKLEGTVVEND
jgi:hypothetical protein